MNELKFNKATNTQYENADSYSNEQENPNTTIDMDLVKQKETIKPGSIRIADSKEFILCTDVENSIEPPADKNEDPEKGTLVNVTALKINIISQKGGRRKYTVMGLYDYVFGSAQQPRAQPRFTRQLWRQEQPPPQPQQTMWTQYGPSQGQGYPHPQGQGYPHPQGQGYPYPPGDGGYQGAYGYDGGGPLLYDPSSRNNFVRLVMGLVLVMLLATAGFLTLVLATPELKEFFQTVGWIILIPALIGLIIVNCAMICSPCARRPPCNFICLIVTTASMSLISAKITSHYRTEIVLYAVIATTAVVFVCVLLACSKFDFTSYLLYIIGIATAFSVIVMIILITMMVTGTMMKPLILAILFIGTLIQSVMEFKNTDRAGVCEILQNYHEYTDSD